MGYYRWHRSQASRLPFVYFFLILAGMLPFQSETFSNQVLGRYLKRYSNGKGFKVSIFFQEKSFFVNGHNFWSNHEIDLIQKRNNLSFDCASFMFEHKMWRSMFKVIKVSSQLSKIIFNTGYKLKISFKIAKRCTNMLKTTYQKFATGIFLVFLLNWF